MLHHNIPHTCTVYWVQFSWILAVFSKIYFRHMCTFVLLSLHYYPEHCDFYNIWNEAMHVTDTYVSLFLVTSCLLHMKEFLISRAMGRFCSSQCQPLLLFVLLLIFNIKMFSLIAMFFLVYKTFLQIHFFYYPCVILLRTRHHHLL